MTHPEFYVYWVSAYFPNPPCPLSPPERGVHSPPQSGEGLGVGRLFLQLNDHNWYLKIKFGVLHVYSCVRNFYNRLGISSGCLATRTPAFSRAVILSDANPEPASTIAPACPIRFPGGAVWPAMNPTTGFVRCLDM